MNMPDLVNQAPQVLSVTELNFHAKTVLEQSFGKVMVQGEISNLSRPKSGHIYFSLKDDAAQIKCAMFKYNLRTLKTDLKDGDEIIVTATVTLYQARGDYQLIVEKIEPIGLGRLQQAFLALKNKLQQAGLFDNDAKRDIPQYPKHIAIVSSATGAAIRDILSVIQRRYPIVRVTLLPTLVQGEDAASDIATAIQRANTTDADVIILARGGGSLEDLWSFNEEIVAQAIFNSSIPVISGIGHETDFTIADFVADFRAPTPSVAAEKATPDSIEIINRLSNNEQQLVYLMRKYILQLSQHVEHLGKRLKHPSERILHLHDKFKNLEQKLYYTFKQILSHKDSAVRYQVQLLNSLNPLNTLARGYTITLKDDKVISDAKLLQQDDEIKVRFHNGEIKARVV